MASGDPPDPLSLSPTVTNVGCVARPPLARCCVFTTCTGFGCAVVTGLPAFGAAVPLELAEEEDFELLPTELRIPLNASSATAAAISAAAFAGSKKMSA